MTQHVGGVVEAGHREAALDQRRDHLPCAAAQVENAPADRGARN
jgi:hypothetical protein